MLRQLPAQLTRLPCWLIKSFGSDPLQQRGGGSIPIVQFL